MKRVVKIPYGRQWLDEEDRQAILRVLQGDFLTQGPEIGLFERAVCEYTGARYAVAVSSGTAALILAVRALDLKPGQSGLTSPITFAATANCLVLNDLVPDFADIDPETHCISPPEIEKRFTPDTRVLIPVHFAGFPADMEKIWAIAKERDCHVIEDAAHAFGSRYKGQRVGNCSHSHMTIFSFHPVKTITTGEGGMITTNDPDLYRRLCKLRHHGITAEKEEFIAAAPIPTAPWYHEMQMLGYNFRLTDLQAALGRSQLNKIDRFAAARGRIVARYNTAFADVEWLGTPPAAGNGTDPLYHLYVLMVDFNRLGLDRGEVMEALAARGIGSQVHYIPVYRHPYYERRRGWKPEDFPQAEAYYRKALSIPLFPRMSDGEVEDVIDAVLSLQ